MRLYFSRSGFIISTALLYGAGVVFTRARCEYHLSKTNITAILLTCKREYHCAARRPKEEPEEKTFEQAYAQRGCCLFVKMKDTVATADMRRHSDTLRAANAATKVGFTGRKQNKRSEFCCLPVISCRYDSAISPVPTAYRSHRVFFLMKNPLCSCMYTPPQSKAVHP